MSNKFREYLLNQAGMVQEVRPMSTWEFLQMMFWVTLIAAIIRSFFFQPFHIPSGSMKSNLLVGDYLFVSKFSYGYSRYSFPFGLIPFDGRFMKLGKPQRGDVVVFRNPADTSVDFIKRVIGLPGDTIQMKDGVLFLNGKVVPKKPLDNFIDDEEKDENGEPKVISRYTETLPNGVSYMVLDEIPDNRLDNTDVYTVPEGHYFMMGDNRDNSQDSRVLNYVGYVPEENLVGKAQIVLFSVNPTRFKFWKVWDWPFSMRADRFVMKIK